jgi:hypothetical protein
MTPQFVICARLAKKVPIFLHALSVHVKEDGYYLDTEVLKDVIKDYERDIQSILIGVRKGFLSNETELQHLTVRGQEIELLSVGEAIEKLADDVSKADMP